MTNSELSALDDGAKIYPLSAMELLEEQKDDGFSQLLLAPSADWEGPQFYEGPNEILGMHNPTVQQK